MQITNQDELRYVTEVINTFSIHAVDGPLKLYDAAAAWFRSKVDNYTGKDLLSQLEKNFVYFSEATGCSVAYASNILKTGEPKVSEAKVDDFIEHVGKTLPQQQHDAILNFLHGYSNTLNGHSFAKVDWRETRRLRESPKVQDYMNFLATESVTFHMATTLADLQLRAYALNPHLSGACSLLPSGIISDTLYGYIMKSCRAIAYYFPAILKDLDFS